MLQINSTQTSEGWEVFVGYDLTTSCVYDVITPKQKSYKKFFVFNFEWKSIAITFVLLSIYATSYLCEQFYAIISLWCKTEKILVVVSGVMPMRPKIKVY